MKESEFYEGLLGLSEIKIDSVKMRDKKIEIYCHTIACEQSCKTCGNTITSVNQYTTRTVRDLDIVGKEVVLEGEAVVKEVSVKQLQHYAKDAGKSEEEIKKITQPKKELQFIAKGVLVL